jgi:hypothetical protein
MPHDRYRSPDQLKRREERVKARTEIVQAANRHVMRGHYRRGFVSARFEYLPTLMSQRNLQRAVCVCRRNALVTPDVLVAAGFNA